jgi:hypothetical protein
MSERSILSLKPAPRLDWRGQDGQNETEQPDHSASLGDSITSSTRIGFLVHTGRCRAEGAADKSNELIWIVRSYNDVLEESSVAVDRRKIVFENGSSERTRGVKRGSRSSGSARRNANGRASQSGWNRSLHEEKSLSRRVSDLVLSIGKSMPALIDISSSLHSRFPDIIPRELLPPGDGEG